MSAVARAHAAAALALVLAVPLVPLGLWLYARAASVDRGDAVAANEAVLDALAQYPGARPLGAHSYELRAWNGESLVPVDAYRTEAFYRLPRAVPPRRILAHFQAQLDDWAQRTERVDCALFGLPAGCGAVAATFRRGGVELVFDVTETMTRPRETREYALYVSQ